MNPKVTAGISGGMGGALLGAITGWLINKGTGAGYGAAIGGVAGGAVGALSVSSSSGTGTAGLPKGMGARSSALRGARGPYEPYQHPQAPPPPTPWVPTPAPPPHLCQAPGGGWEPCGTTLQGIPRRAGTGAINDQLAPSPKSPVPTVPGSG